MWEHDPTVPALPWNEVTYAEYAGKASSSSNASSAGKGAGARGKSSGGKKLKIAYYLTDHFFEPAPSCKRAVLETAEALRTAGHEVSSWSNPGAGGEDDSASGVPVQRSVLINAPHHMHCAPFPHPSSPSPMCRSWSGTP